MTPLNIAHRGGAGLWPENTLFAFQNAVARGFDGAELDVQLTRDGKLVVFHDFRLKPEICRGPDGKWLSAPGELICNLTLAELRAFDIGRPKPGTDYARAHPDLTPYDGERIPLLSKVIEIAKRAKNEFRLFVEIKTNFRDRTQSAPPEAVVEAALATLKEKNFLNRAVVVGFDWLALKHALKLEPNLECWFTTLPPNERKGGLLFWLAGLVVQKFDDSIPKAIKAAGGRGWFPHYLDATPEAVRQAHELGLKLGVWTVDNPATMCAKRDARVDAICTNRPDILAAL